MSKLTKIAAASAVALGLGLGAAGSAHAGVAYAYAYDYVYNFDSNITSIGAVSSALTVGQTSSSKTGYPSESNLSSGFGADVAQSFSGAPVRASENFFGQWANNMPSSPNFGRSDAQLCYGGACTAPTYPVQSGSPTPTAMPWAINNAEALVSLKNETAGGQSLNSLTTQFTGGTSATPQTLTIAFDYNAFMKDRVVGSHGGSWATSAIEFTITLSEFQNGVWVDLTTDSSVLNPLNKTISQIGNGCQTYTASGTCADVNTGYNATGSVLWSSGAQIDAGDQYKLVVTMKESAQAFNDAPEPATAFLAGLGLLGLVASRRAKKA